LVDLEGTHVLGRIEEEVAIGDTVEFVGVFEEGGDPAPVYRPSD
jgi:hypothetical protein